MRQRTFANQSSFEKYGRKSRREEFLSVMEAVVPWRELAAVCGWRQPQMLNTKPTIPRRGGSTPKRGSGWLLFEESAPVRYDGRAPVSEMPSFNGVFFTDSLP
jgi:hypothetical protein